MPYTKPFPRTCRHMHTNNTTFHLPCQACTLSHDSLLTENVQQSVVLSWENSLVASLFVQLNGSQESQQPLSFCCWWSKVCQLFSLELLSPQFCESPGRAHLKVTVLFVYLSALRDPCKENTPVKFIYDSLEVPLCVKVKVDSCIMCTCHSWALFSLLVTLLSWQSAHVSFPTPVRGLRFLNQPRSRWHLSCFFVVIIQNSYFVPLWMSEEKHIWFISIFRGLSPDRLLRSFPHSGHCLGWGLRREDTARLLLNGSAMIVSGCKIV